jgi:hypothetical protein
MLLTSSTKTTPALIARTVRDIMMVDDVLLRPTVPSRATRDQAAAKIQAVARGKRDRERVFQIKVARGLVKPHRSRDEDVDSLDSADSEELYAREQEAIAMHVSALTD